MRRKKNLAVALLWAGTLLTPVTSFAESLNEALALAYANNPSINAQRANTRSVDEAVAIAKSGYRPVIAGNADIGKSWTKTRSPLGTTETTLTPGGFGVSISQSVFDGFQTLNNVNSAKAGVMASRETLRNVEQNILFDAASAYLDVIQNSLIASYRVQALEFLNEQVRSETSRFEVGESTRTDVAQAKARKAGAEAQLSVAQASLASSKAIYQQLVGKEPGKLKKPKGVHGLLPTSLTTAISVASTNHPVIKATNHLVDQAQFNVKSTEGSLLPQLSINGQVNRRYDVAQNTDRDSAQITANLNVPIYQGGRVSAQVRQGKEILGQRRIEVEESFNNVRAAVISAYSQLEAARSATAANRTQTEAAKLALEGAVEERKVGQRTTLDVLNTQQDVLNAQIALAQSERDLVVASYAALSAIGKLDIQTLKLNVARYEPEDHFIQVKDKWFGLRTPDGQ
jgi:outer membrane protein